MIVFDATSPVVAMRKFQRRVARARQKMYAGSWLECFMKLLRKQELVVFRWQTSHVGSPLNEWADRLADLAAASTVVAVPREAVSFGRFYWTAARRGVLQWARQRGAAEVARRLAAAVTETPLRDGKEIRLSPLPGRVALWADRVLAARAHAGDPRLMRELGERCSLCDVACPHGCVDEAGVPVPFTWWHAQFCCRCAPVSSARGKWKEMLREAAKVLGGGQLGTGHPQLRHVLEMVSCGESWQSGLALPIFNEVQLRAARCVLGGAVEQGVSGSDRKAGKLAAWRAVTAGLEVQVVAEAESAGLTRKVKALVQGRGKLARHVAAWRQVVLAGGSARAMALGGMSVAGEAVVRSG